MGVLRCGKPAGLHRGKRTRAARGQAVRMRRSFRRLHGRALTALRVPRCRGIPEVVIGSYQFATSNPQLASLARRVKWRLVVMDEAHFLRNSKTKTYQFCLSLRARVRIGLTGTFYQNNFGEVWSMMNMVLPGRVRSSTSYAAGYVDDSHVCVRVCIMLQWGTKRSFQRTIGDRILKGHSNRRDQREVARSEEAQVREALRATMTAHLACMLTLVCLAPRSTDCSMPCATTCCGARKSGMPASSLPRPTTSCTVN